jgi:transcriptional regulator with GAF, ATPase, and Fis domain
MDETLFTSAFGTRFTLVRRLGAGRSGSTWLARDGERGDECVLKVLVHGAVPEEVREGLRRESESLRALTHPNVVRFREVLFEPERGVAAIAMERVAGETLLDVAGRGALLTGDVVAILVDCARGLAALHSRGLVHRDLQPRNVMVTGGTGSRSAVLVDLGLADRRIGGIPKTFTGTLGFLAPEVLLEGSPDLRTDLYSLGALLYFMLAGEPPADPAKVLDALLRGDDPFPAVERRAREQAPPSFAPILGRLLARHPAARFQSAAEVIEAVNLRFGTSHAVDSSESRRPAISEPPLVGRRSELRGVLRLVAGAGRGRGDATALVRGAARSGRTRFLETVRHLLEFRGKPALRMRPSPPGAPPFDALFRTLGAAAHRLAPGIAASLREAEEARAVAGPESESARTRIASLLAGALRAALDGEPSPALFVDDLERLDPGSQDALRDALFAPRAVGAEGKPGRRVAILAIPAKPVGGRDPIFDSILRNLGRDASVLEVDLRPLPAAAVAEMVEGVLPLGPMVGDLAAKIHEATEGSPGGVVDVLHALLDGGRVVYRPGGWTVRNPGVPLPVPKSAAAVARRRLAGVKGPPREALRALALAGGRLDRGTWDGVRREAELDETADASLRERGLTRVDADGGAVTVASPALREALAEGAGAEARLRGFGLLAGAALAEGRGEAPETVGWLLAAGRDGEALAGGAAALRRLRLEARLADGEALARDLVAAARRRIGAKEAAGVFLEAAYQASLRGRSDDEESLAEEGLSRTHEPAEQRALLLRLCEADAARGRIPDVRVALLEKAGPTEEERLRARLSIARACYTARRFEEAERRVREILPALEAYPHWHLRALVGLVGILRHFARFEETAPLEARALAIAERIGDRSVLLRIRLNRISSGVRARRPRRALREIALLQRSLGPGVSPSEEALVLLIEFSVLESLGKWRQARATAARASSVVESEGLRNFGSEAFRKLGACEAALGDMEAARRHLTRSLRAAEEIGSTPDRAHAMVVLGRVHMERGDVMEARRILEGLVSDRGAGAPGFPARAALLQVEAATVPPSPAVLERVRSTLAEEEAAAWPGDSAELRLLEARILLASDRGDEAREKLRELERALRREGAVDLAARALALLANAPADPRAPAVPEKSLGRALRLARRLENVLVRAEILESCGRLLRVHREMEAEATSCLGEARDLFRAAGLGDRAAAVERDLHSLAGDATLRGLGPERLAWVLDQTRRINESEDPEAVLAALLDSAVTLTGAERGFLVLAAPTGGFEVRVARSMDAREIASSDQTLSASIVRSVLEEGHSVLAAEAKEDPRFAEFFSVRDLRLRSVLAVPIPRGRRVIGAFYLDNRFLAGVFTDEAREALELLAGHAALAFENVKYRVEVRALNRRLQERVQEQEREIDGLRTTMRGLREETKYAYREILRRRGPMVEALRLVDRAVETDLPVLLEGESGTGKELVARAIHFEGPRRERPFVVVNCSAIPEPLLESELFGHRRGSFTGAVADRVGRVEAADGGTLFLDEVGDLPLAIQPKLLRVLQSGEFDPVGAEATRRSSLRVIAATNRDLGSMLAAGTFREDLYYRIAVFPIRLPPLRDRLEDIPALAGAMVRRFAEEAGRGPRRISPQAVTRLQSHDWPGNVRELENLLRRAVVLSAGDVLEFGDLPPGVRPAAGPDPLLEKVRASVPGGLSPREEMAVRRASERGRLTLRDFAASTGISKATGSRVLQRLVRARVLARKGATSAAYYEISPRFAEASARRESPRAR